jgi:hypothetical protein
MANELGPILYSTGASLVAILTNEAGQIWDRVAEEWTAAATATFADCTLALTEQGATGRYYASLPVGVDAQGRYDVVLYLAAASGFADAASMVAHGPVEPPSATAADLTTAKNEIVAAMPGTIDPRGTGADQCTQIILGEDDAPVADAQVWITSDAEGANVVAGTLITNSSGEVFPLLDDGESYYRWAQKDGMNPIRAQAFTAVKDA